MISRRRALGLLGVGASLILLGASPQTLIPRKAKFTEVERKWVRMEVAVADLLRTTDKQAMQNLDSGFATRLVYDLGLYEMGGKDPIAGVHIEVRILLNPWTTEYEVETRTDGGAASVRSFKLRDDAIEAATRIDTRIASSSTLVRGKDNTYFVHVIGQRNPTQSRPGGPSATARGQDRDLEMFSRWVGMFVRSRPQADKTVQFRTSPAFYLVP